MRACGAVRVTLLCAMLLSTGPAPAAAVVKKKPPAKKPPPKSPSSHHKGAEDADDGWHAFKPDPLPDAAVHKASVKYAGASFVPRVPTSRHASEMEMQGAAPMGTARPMHMHQALWHQEHPPAMDDTPDDLILEGAKEEVRKLPAPPVRQLSTAGEEAHAVGPVACALTVCV